MYIKVHVVPGARREKVIQEDDTTLSISVREPAERNMANMRVKEILAQKYGISIGCVKILTGHHSPSKMFVIETKKGV
jgi:uncharacterized protein YggU (UPF0235/DUF167 family)